jgi:hypothetical protein
VLVATVASGSLVCAVAWAMMANRASFSSQTPIASLGIVGLIIAFYGQTTWLLSGRRAIGERSQGLLGHLVTRHGSDAARPESAVLVAGDGLRRYHRTDCLLARGQAWPAAPRERHHRAGRVPCGVCRP